MDLMQQQLKLEDEMFSAGMDRWVRQNKSKGSTEAGTSDWNNRLTKVYLEPLLIALQEDMEKYNKSLRKLPVAIQYLQQCDLYEVAFITIRVILNEVTSRDTSSMQYIQNKIGQHLEDQVRFASLTADPERKGYIAKVQAGLKDSRSKDYDHKKKVYAFAAKQLKHEWVTWPTTAITQLGSYLIKQAVRVVVDVVEDEYGEITEHPLFETRLMNMQVSNRYKTVRIVAVTSAYTEFVADFVIKHKGLFPEALPCVVPPRDWTSPFKGGYHTAKMASRCPMVKVSKEHAKLLTVEQMPVTYEAINWLQQIKWRVNTEILDIAQEVLRDPTHIARPCVVATDPPINPIATRLDELQDLLGVNKLSKEQIAENLSEAERDRFTKWKADKRNWHTAVNESRSKVLEFGRTLAIAERYAIYDDLYFVWNCDYRQRFYTYTSGLGPQASDIAKSLLRFSESHRLGESEDGVFWYKLHGSGLFGHDKDEITDRHDYADSEEFKGIIKRIASDPLKNLEWLSVGGKKKWQFLAWALDYARFLEWVEQDNAPEDFVTHISCQQDGSCSGLQHYSAMLRDEVGGAAVNLTASEVPQDIYNDVVDLVIIDVDVDSRSSDEATAIMAKKWISMGMSRDLTKLSVMTICYSSTRLTCRESISAYISDKEDELKLQGYTSPFASWEDRWAAETYMCALVWNRIGDVVVKAKEGMRFYQDIAKAYAKAGKPMMITSKTGFIMMQEAYQTKSQTVDTVLHGRMQFKSYINTEKLDVRKMQTMGPPNGIHLQDSTHVAFAVVDAKRKGIRSLWVVHDDFGTHGGRTGELQHSLRHSMVEMYRENVLAAILEEARVNLGDKAVAKIKLPKYGKLNIEEILESKYAFL